MPAFGGGGIAFGASGKLYVALFAKYQLSILDSDGAEELRFPSPEENAAPQGGQPAEGRVNEKGDGQKLNSPVVPTGPGFYTLLAQIRDEGDEKPPRWPYTRTGPIPPAARIARARIRLGRSRS